MKVVSVGDPFLLDLCNENPHLHKRPSRVCNSFYHIVDADDLTLGLRSIRTVCRMIFAISSIIISLINLSYLAFRIVYKSFARATVSVYR